MSTAMATTCSAFELRACVAMVVVAGTRSLPILAQCHYVARGVWIVSSRNVASLFHVREASKHRKAPPYLGPVGRVERVIVFGSRDD